MRFQHFNRPMGCVSQSKNKILIILHRLELFPQKGKHTVKKRVGKKVVGIWFFLLFPFQNMSTHKSQWISREIQLLFVIDLTISFLRSTSCKHKFKILKCSLIFSKVNLPQQFQEIVRIVGNSLNQLQSSFFESFKTRSFLTFIDLPLKSYCTILGGI